MNTIFSMVGSAKALTLVTACTVAITMISGCKSIQDAELISASPIKDTGHLSGKHIIPVSTPTSQSQRWLATSEVHGLMLVDDAGNVLHKTGGEVETLDIRQNIHWQQQSITLAATVDKTSNQPQLYAINDQSSELTRLLSIPSPKFEIEDICLFKDSQNLLHLFLVSEKGLGEQWLISDQKSGVINPLLVRTLSLPPASIACSVDDQHSRLLVVEEDRGVWSYPADVESGHFRKAITLSHSSITDLVATHDGFIAVKPNQRELLRFVLDNQSQLTESYRYSLQGIDAPETVNASWVSDNNRLQHQLRIGLFDDETGNYFQAAINDRPMKTEPAETLVSIAPTVQTQPIGMQGDVADDPAIWVNQSSPENSLVFGTNKKKGLHIYDLAGEELQFFPSGKLNNVDIRYGFPSSQGVIDLAAASNRSNNSISLFTILPDNGQVSEAGSIPTTLDKVYGICMYQPAADQIHVFINDKDGRYEQYQVTHQNGQLGGQLVRAFRVNSQPEGCVASDRDGTLFVGEEGEGVWVIGANPEDGTELNSIAKTGGILQSDVEGLAIYHQAERAYLLVSSQGNDSYVVMNAHAPYEIYGAFRVGINSQSGIDGSSETDGIEVTSANLGLQFPKGMLVVQDGRNRMPENTQNFKYIPWQSIQAALNLE
ncbi:phytase [Endozoicomonas ascidiicola]|uniref:phytase n=1 Tax=Endozoicomonas ascidiicola TaxID=1698521 RepID=UPI00082D63AC|nr:phytase [Endozoicomonas ascidiicola]